MSGRPTDRRRGPRRLEADEQALFERAMRAARPLRQAAPAPAPLPMPPAAPPKPALQPPQSALPPAAPLPPLAPGAIDRRTARRLQRGQMAVEARLDLHGDDQATAHARLARFIAEQAAAGRRCVLVITGKGGGAAAPFGLPERGVLRRQVPLWLAAPGLRRFVAGIGGAGRQHGGAGAYYVMLRRPR